MQLRGRMGYGVATNVYGSGMVVGESFDTLPQAEEFASTKLLGGAAVCRFSDGRWRPICDAASEARIEELRINKQRAVQRREPLKTGWLRDGVQHP